MSEIKNKDLNIDLFLEEVHQKVKEGMDFRDAIHLTAVMTSGPITNLVSQADGKYQEATSTRTELSQQSNVDECALASMGEIWHGENFEGSTEHIDSSEEEIILDSLYFILKYAEYPNALESALSANDSVCGDKTARKKLIEMAFIL